MVRNYKFGVFLALVFAASMWVYMYRVLVPYQHADAAAHDRPRGNLSDLYPRWLGTRELLLHHRNPYRPEITREIQAGYYGRELDSRRPGDPKDQQAFAYPVYVAFLLAPTVGYPFELVRTAFQWFLVVLTAASVWLWISAIRWRPHPAVVVILVALTVGCFPVVLGLKLQQLSLLVAPLIALGAALLVRGHLFTAGLVLAVATIKPQLVLPLLGCLLLWTASDWSRRQRFLWGFALAMAVLLVGAQVILPGWANDFRWAVRDYRQYTGGMSLLDTLLSKSVGTVVALAVLAGLALLGWRFRRSEPQSREFAPVLATILAATFIVIPMFTLYNEVLLLPALLVVVREWQGAWDRSGVSRLARLLIVVTVGWPWLASLALSIASFVVSPETVQRGWAVPLYTIMAIPLVVLVQLVSLVVEAQRGTANRDGYRVLRGGMEENGLKRMG